MNIEFYYRNGLDDKANIESTIRLYHICEGFCYEIPRYRFERDETDMLAKRLIKEINQESVNYKDYLVDFMLKLQK